MNSTHTLLSFYFDMLFVNTIQSVRESFIGNSTLQKNEYSYIQEYDYCMKEEMVEDNGTSPIFVIDIIRKEDFLDKLMTFENKFIYKNIESEILKEPGVVNNVAYLKGINDEIELLLKRVIKLEDADINLVEKKLIEIIILIKDRFPTLIEYHNVFKYLIKETDITFFRDKDLKYSFYISLYEMAYTLNIIDDSEIKEIDFINAFTSPNPELLKNKIRFFCNNYVAGYFLESLKPFFYEFNHTKVELSKVFLNKQNKPFKGNDIYVSLSRGKDKIDIEKSRIDKYISNLKKEYLK
jgi:hypothetical protein